MNSHGPYETREQAVADTDAGADRTARYDTLARACAAAGITTGEFDRQILGWLASWETDTVQVIVGLIKRSHAAGRDQLADEIRELNARLDMLETAARRGAPVGVDLAEIRIITKGRRG